MFYEPNDSVMEFMKDENYSAIKQAQMRTLMWKLQAATEAYNEVRDKVIKEQTKLIRERDIILYNLKKSNGVVPGTIDCVASFENNRKG